MQKLINDELHTEESIIMKYERMVYKGARRLSRGRPQENEDLQQEGFIGLVKAFRNYDDTRGDVFTTYAHRYINGQMIRYNDKSGGIGVSSEVIRTAWKMERGGLWREDDLTIAKALGVTKVNVKSARKYFDSKDVGSIDKTDDEGIGVANHIGYEMDLTTVDIPYYLKSCDDRELHIVKLLLQDLSYSEIGEILGKTKAAVYQNIKKLRLKIKLRMYVDGLVGIKEVQKEVQNKNFERKLIQRACEEFKGSKKGLEDLTDILDELPKRPKKIVLEKPSEPLELNEKNYNDVRLRGFNDTEIAAYFGVTRRQLGYKKKTQFNKAMKNLK